ncbi:hypothetical protein [Microcystis aeruginosa]|nr:hypothetical protein [Microcystis aeruginosa]
MIGKFYQLSVISYQLSVGRWGDHCVRVAGGDHFVRVAGGDGVNFN